MVEDRGGVSLSSGVARDNASRTVGQGKDEEGRKMCKPGVATRTKVGKIPATTASDAPSEKSSKRVK